MRSFAQNLSTGKNQSGIRLIQQREKHSGTGEGVVKGVVAVDAVDAERFNQVCERIAIQSRAQMTGERERVACFDAVRREAETELSALLIEHPHVELVVVRYEQHIASQKLEELAHRLFRRTTMLREEIQRQAMYPFCPGIHFTRRADVRIECARLNAIHILHGGYLTDFIVARAASRLSVKNDHPPTPGVFRNLRQCVGTYSHDTLS